MPPPPTLKIPLGNLRGEIRDAILVIPDVIKTLCEVAGHVIHEMDVSSHLFGPHHHLVDPAPQPVPLFPVTGHNRGKDFNKIQCMQSAPVWAISGKAS